MQQRQQHEAEKQSHAYHHHHEVILIQRYFPPKIYGAKIVNKDKRRIQKKLQRVSSRFNIQQDAQKDYFHDKN